MRRGDSTIEIANFLAVCTFNEEFYSVYSLLWQFILIMTLMGINMSHQAKIFVESRNSERIDRSQLSEKIKEARRSRKVEKSALHVFHVEEEDILYGVGIAD